MNKKINTDIPKEILEELKQEKRTFTVSRTDKIPTRIATDIISDIKNTYNFDDMNYALSVIAVFAQKGGTSKTCDGNMSIFYLGRNIKLSEIRNILAKHKYKQGMRKLARTYATKIFIFSKTLEVEGNLYKKIKKKHINAFTEPDYKYWASDFQAHNEEAPEAVRKLILESFTY